MESLQQPKEKKVMGTAWSCFYVVGSAERNYHWGTVLNAIDAFEPSTARKTATIQAEARKSDSTA